MVSGPIRHELASLRLQLLRPGLAAQRHDRARARPDAAQHRRRQAGRDGPLDPGNPAKYTSVSRERGRESLDSYHVQRGFGRATGVVTVMSAKARITSTTTASNTGVGLLTTFAAACRRPAPTRSTARAPMSSSSARACRDLEARRLHHRHLREELFQRSRIHCLADFGREPRHLHQHGPQAGPATGSRSGARRRISTSPWPAAGQAFGFHPVLRRHTVASVRIAG